MVPQLFRVPQSHGLALIFFIVQLTQAFSQTSAGNLLREVNVLAARNAVGGLTYNQIEGSPYYSDEFIQSEVLLKDGSLVSVPIRYDLFQDEIEFRRENITLWLSKRNIASIKMGVETLLVDSPSNEAGEPGYFFVQDTGEYSLFIKRNARFIPAVPARGYTEAIPDRFERENDLFFIKKHGSPVQEIQSKKALQRILADNPQALDFVKKNRIGINKSEGLQALVSFLNNQ